jgi:hypothetical protein
MCASVRTLLDEARRFGGMKKLARASAILSVFVLVACGGGDGGSDGNGGGGGAGGGNITIGPDGVPVGPDGKPLPPKLDGRYELSNQIDLTTTGVLPGQVAEVLKDLSNFEEHPTQTMVDLLNAAHVPVVSDVLNAIPSVIRDQLFGFMDDHLVKSLFQNVPFAQSVATMLDDLGSLATKFEIVSSLDIPPTDAIGNAQGTHALTGVAYTWGDKRHVIDGPSVLVQLESKSVKVNAVPLEKLNSQIETGRLSIDDHSFAVPIGSFAVFAADTLAQDKLGAKDLRDGIGKFVDCHGIGQAVATKCIGVGPAQVCVGHAAEVEKLCNAGLDILVSTLEDRVKALDIPALHLKSGTAKMWDAPTPGGPMDAVVDRIDNGFWTAGIGKEDKPAILTFTGKRVGDHDGAPSAPPATH